MSTFTIPRPPQIFRFSPTATVRALLAAHQRERAPRVIALSDLRGADRRSFRRAIAGGAR